MTPYHWVFNAMQRGDTRELEAILGSGLLEDVNGCHQPLLLLWAVGLGSIPAAELLIAKGADVNLPVCGDTFDPVWHGWAGDIYPDGIRPLHAAVKYGKTDAVLLLLRAGAEVNAADTNGVTPLALLFHATTVLESPQVSCDIAEVLLSAGADPRLSHNDQGALPLHCAAFNGNIGAIDLLLSAAPDSINRRDRKGWTALGLASSEGKDIVVAHLLAAGASIQASAPHCILRKAIAYTREGVVRAITKYADGSFDTFTHTALSVAVFVGHARILQHVFEMNGGGMRMAWARLNYSGTCTPLLHFAASHSILSSVRFLLAAGADEAQIDAEGRRARDVVGVMDSEKFFRDGFRIPGDDKEGAAGNLHRRCRDRGSKECTIIHHLLEQGPAFRSHPWCWPAENAAAPCAANRGRDPPASSSRATTTTPGVRTFRPKQTAFFADTIGRYASREEHLRGLHPVLAMAESF